MSATVCSSFKPVARARAAQRVTRQSSTGTRGAAPAGRVAGSVSLKSLRNRNLLVANAEDPKKETLSALDSMLDSGEKAEEAKPADDGALYDDGKEPKFTKTEMSMEQKKKLRDEYLGLGGSPDKPIPNYFLYIIVVISALAVASALTGAI